MTRSTRTYRKRKRKRAEEATRRRITEAAVELHGTVGPANATVTDIAKLAGVSRATVYNHFPTDADLFRGCSSHWAAENPFPDPSSWTLADPSKRLVTGLEELYGWYRANEDMLGNVLRDLRIIEALAEVMGALWVPYVQGVVAALAEGWSTDTVDADSLDAMLLLAVDFNTWQLLRNAGMDDEAAAATMTRMVTGAVG
jgi:AcrR family transcriptional regulator